MTNDASEYLSEQISYLKRAAKLNYATAFLLSALVAGYGAFAFWAMSPFTNADELSNYTLHRVAASAPEFIEATEQTLASRSGEFADGVSVALQKAIPQMRQSAERTLNAMLGNGVATHIAFLGIGLPQDADIVYAQYVGGYSSGSENSSTAIARALAFSQKLDAADSELLVGAATTLSSSNVLKANQVIVRFTFATTSKLGNP